MKRLAMLFGIALLAAIVGSAAGEGKQGITVLGEGTVAVPADVAIISVGVQSSNPNASIAAAENEERLNRTIEALTYGGVKKEEIMSGRSSGIISSQVERRICRNVSNNLTCENISNISSLMTSSIIIRLKTADQSKIDNVIATARSQGAFASLDGYSLSSPDAAYAQARKKAVENARSSAEEMAAIEGVKLGDVIDMWDFGIPDIMETPFWSPATEPGTVSVTSYVRITYEIV